MSSGTVLGNLLQQIPIAYRHILAFDRHTPGSQVGKFAYRSEATTPLPGGASVGTQFMAIDAKRKVRFQSDENSKRDMI